MKKYIYIIGAVASLAFTSCAKEVLEAESGQEIEYDESCSLYGYAEGEGDDAKTYIGDIDGHKYAFWNQGEEIMGFKGEDIDGSWQIHKKYKYYAAKVYDNKTKARFCIEKGQRSAGKLDYVMYPYQEGAYLQCGGPDTNVVFNFPYRQKYKKGTFDDGVNFALAKVHQISDTVQNADFKNLFGYLRLSLKCDNFPGENSAPFRVKGIRIFSYNMDKLSGTFVACAAWDTPFAIGMKNDRNSDGTRKDREDYDAELYLDCSGEPGGGVLLNSETAEEFFFVIPAGALASGFQATVYCDCGGTEDRVNVDIEANSDAALNSKNIILRSVVKTMPTVTVHNFPAEHFELLDYIESDGHTFLNTGFIVNDGVGHEGIGLAMRGQMLTSWCDWDTFENQVLLNQGKLMWDNAAFCGVVERYDTKGGYYRNWLTVDGLYGSQLCRISYNNDNLFGRVGSPIRGDEIGQGNFNLDYAFLKGNTQCYAIVNHSAYDFIGFQDVLTPPVKDNESDSDTWAHPNREQLQQPYLYLFGVRCLKTRATAWTQFIEQNKKLSATYNKTDPYFKSRSRISYFKIYNHANATSGALDRDPVINWIPVRLKEDCSLINRDTGVRVDYPKGAKGFYDYVNNQFWWIGGTHFRYSGDPYFVWERTPEKLW